MPSADAGRHAPSVAVERKRASGCSREVVGVGRRRSSRSCRSAALLCSRSRQRTVGVAVARYYDPSTAQFLTRDPIEAETRDPYGYADGDPVNETDPSGLCWVPGGVCDWLYDNLTQGPGATVGKVFVSIGNGATFGAAGDIDQDLSPGADCYFQQLHGGYRVLQDVTSVVTTVLTAGAGASRLGWRAKFAWHDAHHAFGPWGKLPHLQWNWWKAGVKGSGHVFRIPLPPWLKP